MPEAAELTCATVASTSFVSVVVMVCRATRWSLPIGTLPACVCICVCLWDTGRRGVDTGECQDGVSTHQPNNLFQAFTHHHRPGGAPLGGVHSLAILSIQVDGGRGHSLLGIDLRAHCAEGAGLPRLTPRCRMRRQTHSHTTNTTTFSMPLRPGRAHTGRLLFKDCACIPAGHLMFKACIGYV
eukprot:508138-Pelagomonas_calceolata.AAC.1